ncbi:hypothetical protein VHEMI09326 [[Torrubiella] hemipterigena]|uniref:Uncharacterized protein n=1 Tax=[Torrubiella] hemipterigena TaxID=1531966 RepID=A0A0A1TRC1_9HYPO|nr:hypothetical protein VHEMI09326 [[Torrubiella] hemipterigena]
MPTTKDSRPNRRWRAYKPAVTNSPNPAADAATSTDTGRTNRQIEVEFVNVSNLRETTSPTSLSIVRRHVANHAHASRGSSLALRRHADPEDRRHVLLTSLSTHTFQICVRPLVPLEQQLLSYYATSVIPEMPAWCNHSGEEDLFLELVNSFWLPFIITDPGLLAAVLLASCRNMLLHNRRADALGEGQANWSELALKYKIECISSVNTAIVTELPYISDATIAKTMVMATDEASVAANQHVWDLVF